MNSQKSNELNFSLLCKKKTCSTSGWTLGVTTWTKFDEFSENFRMGGGHFQSEKLCCAFSVK